MPHKTILIMAGGTGGHIYPALAVAAYLRTRDASISWLGTAAGLEARVVPAAGYPLEQISVSGVRGKGFLALLRAPFMVLYAVYQAASIMRRLHPDAVLGMGGFTSGPGGVAAWLLGIPLCIHEQNSIPGLTNRLLAPMGRVVMEGFPGTFRRGRRVRTTGIPVRDELAVLDDPDRRLRRHPPGQVHLLILGGSQGARMLNEVAAAAYPRLSRMINLRIWHQTGERLYQQTRSGYGAAADDERVRIDPYIEDMAVAYDWADVVLCRAGASTIAELCSVGVASVLVPFPFAVDDHQTGNARYLSEQGCAVLLPESELEARRLTALITDLCTVRDRLLDMARKARGLARPQAARDVGDICLEGIGV